MSEALFIEATRKKYRFLHKGEISVEQLWDLDLESLDAIFQKLNLQKKEIDGVESLLSKKNSQLSILDNKIDIIKFIVKTKQDEATKNETAAAVFKRRQELNELIDRKKKASDEDKSVEELQEELKQLQLPL